MRKYPEGHSWLLTRNVQSQRAHEQSVASVVLAGNKDEIAAIILAVVSATYYIRIRIIRCQLEREEMLTTEQIGWIVLPKTSKRRALDTL